MVAGTRWPCAWRRVRVDAECESLPPSLRSHFRNMLGGWNLNWACAINHVAPRPGSAGASLCEDSAVRRSLGFPVGHGIGVHVRARAPNLQRRRTASYRSFEVVHKLDLGWARRRGRANALAAELVILLSVITKPRFERHQFAFLPMEVGRAARARQEARRVIRCGAV
jgi:hypothetical protein